MARKYLVIGGNIPGVNPDQEEDTYTMSKKERRRRERERGEENFKNGNYKKKKKNKSSAKINYDKLEEKVSKSKIGALLRKGMLTCTMHYLIDI